jgi:hypothetical protein
LLCYLRTHLYPFRTKILCCAFLWCGGAGAELRGEATLLATTATICARGEELLGTAVGSCLDKATVRAVGSLPFGGLLLRRLSGVYSCCPGLGAAPLAYSAGQNR